MGNGRFEKKLLQMSIRSFNNLSNYQFSIFSNHTRMDKTCKRFLKTFHLNIYQSLFRKGGQLLFYIQNYISFIICQKNNVKYMEINATTGQKPNETFIQTTMRNLDIQGAIEVNMIKPNFLIQKQYIVQNIYNQKQNKI
ncbi:unnamed protein product [Paramecium sonneborni]|uniref:Uncharacterized protein n=1 Tax=Paramecium sonneborni TaxID=65129 RepID=A0A8S1LVE0_9CILI|nr:unnamed protein product [Paramecium sonneborni]CAD8068766.1 unnamed protein product [Paramecium sonneborni]